MKTAVKIIIWFVSILFVVSIIAGPYFLITRDKQPKYEYFVAKKTTLTQKTDLTGIIEPFEKVNLSFEKAGKVNNILIDVGDKVCPDNLLIALQNAELTSQLAQYNATLEKEQIKLSELIIGARDEEITIAQTKLLTAGQVLNNAETDLVNTENSADVDLANAYGDVEDTLQEAYADADNSVNKQIDNLFINDSTDSPSLSFSTSNITKANEAERQRVSARDALDNFQETINSITQGNEVLSAALNTAKTDLNIIRDFLNVLSDATAVAAGINQTTINTYKGYVNTARTNINSALSAINNQKQTILLFIAEWFLFYRKDRTF